MSQLDILRSIGVHGGDCIELMRAMPADSVDSCVCDPPYELGFMGKSWDSTGVAFDPATWAEVLRVLKPGGHLVAFGGTRTVHRIAVAIEDAGFEIRDTLHWCYWSGFPKSLDVSKSLDVLRDDRNEVVRVTAWIRDARDAAGISNAALDEPFGFAGMAGHWTTVASQPSVPTLEQWPIVCLTLGVTPPPEIDSLVTRLNDRKGTWGNERPDRQTSHVQRNNVYRSGRLVDEPGTPQTDDARQWAGWGSAVKPAVEPAILARKPLSESSIARNVLRWGTGGLNVDGCRFSPGDVMWPGPQDASDWSVAGRFPANLLYCPKASRAERELGCEGLPHGNGATKGTYGADITRCPDHGGTIPSGANGSGYTCGCPRAYRTGAEAVGRKPGSDGLNSPRADAGRTADTVRNFHPTVKPARLMRYLCRLVTPPGGTVLDPFAGSGTCGAAAALEGFAYIGAEKEKEYAAIARARIAHARAFPTSWAHTAPGFVGDASAEVEEAVRAGQMGLFA